MAFIYLIQHNFTFNKITFFQVEILVFETDYECSNLQHLTKVLPISRYF